MSILDYIWDGPYTKMVVDMHRPKRKKVTKMPRQTCPLCKRKLVTLYKVGDQWMCNACKIGVEIEKGI